MPKERLMRAIVINSITPAADIHLDEVPVPTVRPGWTLIRMHGRGLNHSEQVLREEEITESYIKHPVIPGIEGVGVAAEPSDSGLTTGQPVCALMGGMGRSWDGSYAEYCLVRNDHLFAIPQGSGDPSLGNARGDSRDLLHRMGLALRVSTPRCL